VTGGLNWHRVRVQRWDASRGRAAICMRAEGLLDTNILIYSISTHPAESAKRNAANQLIASVDFGVSTQICQEFFVVATRKIERPITVEEALEFLRLLVQRPLVVAGPDMIFRAIEIQQRFGISYWDAAIVAAAHELEASTIYSEDLNHGQRYGRTQVVNPFVALS
jgi:predicted nucleic acid-binding protein